MKKILVVDDNIEDLESIKTILEREKYEPTIAGDGAEALDLLNEGDFGLILIDID